MAETGVPPVNPLPKADQVEVDGFHIAILFTETPPAVVKNPPT